MDLWKNKILVANKRNNQDHLEKQLPFFGE